MEDIIISFYIDEPKLISVNEQYMHPVRKTKSGKYYSYFASSPYLVEVQEFYAKVLLEKISDDDIARLKEYVTDNKEHGLELEIIIGMPMKKIGDSDVSNFIKAIEDCIVKRTGIDDVKDYKVISEKALYDNEDKLKMRIRISSYELRVMDLI